MNIPYTIRRHRRARNLKLTIDPQKGVMVTLPYFVPNAAAAIFVNSNEEWIKKHLAKIPQRDTLDFKAQYLKHKARAWEFVMTRLNYFNQFYNFKFNKVTIRNQSSRWGSCSSKKNLSFNYKIVLLEPHLADYIVVHELCHLKQMNHGKAFWELVASTIPNHKQIRKEIKSHHLRFM